MLIRFAVLATLGSVASATSQQATYQTSDFLPLHVGNSWTYGHFYSDQRYGEDGIKVSVVAVREEFTISILRTEVIDGETYFVFSDMPSDDGPPAPRHFIAGKKVRWSGNDLMEHDGTSEFSILRFKSPLTRPGLVPYEYSIPVAHGKGDDSVEAFINSSHTPVRIPKQHFTFIGYRDYGSSPAGAGARWQAESIIAFIGGYGVRTGIEGLYAGDQSYLTNRVYPLRATLHTPSSTSDTRDGSTDSPTTTTIEWEDLNCYMALLCEDATSTRSSTWGKTKSSIK